MSKLLAKYGITIVLAMSFLGLMVFVPVYFSANDENRYTQALIAELKTQKGVERLNPSDPDLLSMLEDSSNYGKERFRYYLNIMVALISISVFMMSWLSAQITLLMSIILLMPVVLFGLEEQANTLLHAVAALFGMAGNAVKHGSKRR